MNKYAFLPITTNLLDDDGKIFPQIAKIRSRVKSLSQNWEINILKKISYIKVNNDYMNLTKLTNTCTYKTCTQLAVHERTYTLEKQQPMIVKNHSVFLLETKMA